MKKKIDDIYRERFRDVETTPPKDAWENISAALPSKKKRRILPFWYEIAGTAAVLALLFTLFQTISGNQNDTTARLIGFEFNKKHLELNPVSSGFRESMLRSSIILEALKMNSNQGLTGSKAPSGQAVKDLGNYFADIAEGSQGKDKTELTYTFPNYLKVKPLIITPSRSTETVAETSNGAATTVGEEEQNEEIAGVDPFALKKDKEPDEIADASSTSKRFSVTTSAAAVYFDNLGAGNALDGQFASNSSAGELTMAYGVNLAYQLTPRVKVRTGVSKVNLSHNTNNVGVMAAAQSQAINSPAVNPYAASSMIASPDGSSGYLNQSLGFIEIPLEMEFALVNSKIGLNLIGGASTFFLNENMISHNSPMATTDLGEANNLNNVSFSTNIGMGINYNITQQFQLNLEPIFKYQLNTYNNSAGLSPYIFGVYSGLSFKF